MNKKSSLVTTIDFTIDPVENSLLKLVSNLIVEIIKEDASRQNDEPSDAKATNS